MRLHSTREVGDLLDVSSGRLIRAVWLRHISPPEKGPGGAYLWREDDLRRACSYFLHRPLEAVLAERQKGGVS